MEKPIFIPLKRQYYNDFANEIKTTEYRQYGKRWNEKVCRIGRMVVLSLGYGISDRLRGIVTGFRKVPILKSKGGAAFWLCYGTQAIGPVAEIDIKIMQRELTERWYIYQWGNNAKRAGLKGMRCRVIARGKMNTAMVKFETGQIEITSRNALKKEK